GRLLGRVATRESRDGRRQRRAPLFPVFETIDGELQSRLVTGGNRVVEPEALDEFAVAPAALVRRDDVIEGALLGTTARQADDNHVRFPCSESEKPTILAQNRPGCTFSASFRK